MASVGYNDLGLMTVRQLADSQQVTLDLDVIRASVSSMR